MYNTEMITIKIGENEQKQRTDRFLKKYFRNAPLSYVYKLIRTSVKVNGKRPNPESLLALDDVMEIHISEEQAQEYRGKVRASKAKRQFTIAYEDESILIVEKPFGLLTHGTKEEKKNTLANQVIAYLIEKGDFRPSRETTFSPAPANRLDRNTTGLVLFGKTYEALISLNQLLRERDSIQKYYLTIVAGELKKELRLVDRMEKDEKQNKITIMRADEEGGKTMETIVRPVLASGGYTLAEVELHTGRTHQIRAQLANAGFPIIGDEKYGDRKTNQKMQKRFGLTTQLLHAARLVFEGIEGPLSTLNGKEIQAASPPVFAAIEQALFGTERKGLE